MEQSDVALWWLRLYMKLNYDTVMYASIGWLPKTSVKRDCSVLVKLHTRRIGTITSRIETHVSRFLESFLKVRDLIIRDSAVEASFHI